VSAAEARLPYRMRDLCRLTGLERQVVHFYIKEGLLPEGEKTGRNMAWYGEEHLERLRTIKRLQEEHFLPLRAIRAVFEARADTFTPAQERMLLAIKSELAGTLAPPDIQEAGVPVDELLAKYGLERQDFDEIVTMGLIVVRRDAGGRELISASDVWMIENQAEFRRLGFSRELGFGADDMAIYEETLSRLVMVEAERLTARLAHLPPAEVASMLSRGLPLLEKFIVRHHAAKIRNFFAALL
jgi:DNA-binding transcriptional MerR regulator